MAKNKKKKDLVQLIKDNPGCIAVIDNDCWNLSKNTPQPDDWEAWTWDKQEAWDKDQQLADSDDDLVRRGNGYGSGNCYGGDILQALAEIVGIKVESV